MSENKYTEWRGIRVRLREAVARASSFSMRAAATKKAGEKTSQAVFLLREIALLVAGRSAMSLGSRDLQHGFCDRHVGGDGHQALAHDVLAEIRAVPVSTCTNAATPGNRKLSAYVTISLRERTARFTAFVVKQLGEDES
jgi:hypothetical protein